MSENPIASIQYQALITTPEQERWYQAAKTWSQRTMDQQYTRKVQDGVHNYIRQRIGSSLPIPQLEWVRDDGIQRVTGGDIAIPVLTFADKDLGLYSAIAGRGSMPAGLSVRVPTNLLVPGEPGYRSDDFTYIVMVPQSGGEIPFEQRRRHEGFHLIDPNLRIRKEADAVAMGEVIAVLGELTSSSLNMNIARVDPSFFIFYIENSPLGASRGKLNLEQAESLSDMMDALTSLTWPKTPNSEIVRKIMGCHSLNDIFFCFSGLDVKIANISKVRRSQKITQDQLKGPDEPPRKIIFKRIN